MRYTVLLAHRRNSDLRGGYWTQVARPDSDRLHECDSLEEASHACRTYLDTYDLASSNWSGGEVRDESGTVVANISYNGRIILPRPTFTPRTEA